MMQNFGKNKKIKQSFGNVNKTRTKYKSNEYST